MSRRNRATLTADRFTERDQNGNLSDYERFVTNNLLCLTNVSWDRQKKNHNANEWGKFLSSSSQSTANL